MIGMVQRRLQNYAVKKGAPTKPVEEASAFGTGQRSQGAVKKDAPNKL